MKSRLPRLITICFILASFIYSCPKRVSAQDGKASIYLSPAQGTFEVGSTFDISFFVSTGGDDINAVRLDLKFPADKLQIVKPTTGNSFISIWITQPEYSNTAGSATFQGGLPSPGINTTAGLITTITFRVKASGPAIISVLNSSQVLANDGHGTNVLTSFGKGSYNLTMPAPEGPIIISSTHGDQNKWYRNNNPSFSWRIQSPVTEDGEELYSVDGILVDYSWDFNQDPQFIPDNESEGQQTFTAYEEVESGLWYFHCKAQLEGVWGQTSHYVVKIDTHPPAAFEIGIEPGSGGPDLRRIIDFVTTDQHSGIDHYEIKVESLTDPTSNSTFFVEATSPWQLEPLPAGEYRVIVRAFDLSGNWYDAEATFEVRSEISSFLTLQGFRIFSFLCPWWLIIILILILIVLLFFLFRKLRKQYKDPSNRLAMYLRKLKDGIRSKRLKLTRQLDEEKEIQEVLTKELEEEPKHEEPKEEETKPLEEDIVPSEESKDKKNFFARLKDRLGRRRGKEFEN